MRKLIAWLIGFAGVLALLSHVGLEIWNGLQRQADQKRTEGLQEARQRLSAELETTGLSLGAPVFMRIFKESRELEIWLKGDDSHWRHFRTYEICNYSGDLGPKLKEGDRQSPEGLYSVAYSQLNPNSRFHLSFNLGFPNAYDRAQGRTGSFLMVHGDCVSIGCYAMTDDGIEEIYAMAEAALKAGQKAFWVHSFPARFSDTWLESRSDSPWIGFWRDLKICHDHFEDVGHPPAVSTSGGKYRCT